MTKSKNTFTSFRTKWITIAISAVLFITTLILLIVASKIAWTNGYKGNAKLANSNNIFTTKNQSEWSWGTVSVAYRAIFFGMILASLIGLFVLGSWLRGSKWINRKNIYDPNKTYVRNGEQNLIFRTVILIAAIAMLWSFSSEVFYDIVDNANKDPDEIFKATWDYLIDPSDWYYQCFLSSLFISIALIRRKYNWMLVLLPISILGASRTFVDVKDDWGEDAVWESVAFHRFMMIHVTIIVAPLFVAFANRNRYDLITIKRTILYTFLTVFIAYALIIISYRPLKDPTKTPGTVDLDGYGELAGAGVLLGKDITWINDHYNVYFWFIVVPFGISVILGMVLISNITHFVIGYKKSAFIKWWETVKEKEWPILLDGMYTSRRLINQILTTKVKLIKKYKYIQFGLETPKGVERQNII